MRHLFNIITFMALTNLCFAQNNENLDSLIRTLDNYMSTHIPDMNSGVRGYKNELENKILTKITLLFDDESHRKSFELENSNVKLEKLSVDRKSARVYGYKYYYEISIGDNWFMSDIEQLKVAERIESL